MRAASLCRRTTLIGSGDQNRSQSATTHVITGTHWNGETFFGIKRQRETHCGRQPYSARQLCSLKAGAQRWDETCPTAGYVVSFGRAGGRLAGCWEAPRSANYYASNARAICAIFRAIFSGDRM